MPTTRITPLAWLNLTHHTRRFLTSLAGITFAVVLMFVEFGFRNALLDCTVELVLRLDADLVMVSRAKYTLASAATFNRRRLDQAGTAPEVLSVAPLYIEARSHVLRVGHDDGARSLKLRVLAFDPSDRVFQIPAVEARSDALKVPDTAILDQQSRGFEPAILAEPDVTLSRRPVRLVGAFRMGTDFVNDGNLIMSDRNFLKFFPDRRLAEPDLRLVDLGLIRLRPGSDAEAVADRLRDALRGGSGGPLEDVTILTRADLVRREREFWRESTPIGFVFGLGLVMGFVVGVVICYQILSSDISTHMAEYATMKAMGYGPAKLIRLVVDQAIILATLGFLPGLLISQGLYMALSRVTGLPLLHTPMRVGIIFACTVGMCLLSGWIAIRKLFAADPAELFK